MYKHESLVIPILDDVGDNFGETSLIFSFLFLSINASSINGLEESGLICSGGGFGNDKLPSIAKKFISLYLLFK